MPKAKTRALILAASLFVVLSGIRPVAAQDLIPGVPEAVAVSSHRLERLDSAMQNYVGNDRLAGAVVLVARRGRVIYHKAFGKRDLESGAAMEKDSIFRIASQSKALVSAGVMALQEQGELLITDRLSKYLPEFKATTVAVENDEVDMTSYRAAVRSFSGTFSLTLRASATAVDRRKTSGRTPVCKAGISPIAMSPSEIPWRRWGRCRSTRTPVNAGSTDTTPTSWAR